jgi:dATP/dGTP diphosphohydrolase, N-terminal
MSEGIKYDESKAPMSLVPVAAKIEMAKAFGYGAKKYGKWNYKKGMEWTRLLSATERHLDAFKDRENIDPESQINHLGHALASIAMLMDYYANNLGTDDRYNDKEEESQRTGTSERVVEEVASREPAAKETTG